MVFDLRRALLKKGEVETARLQDFAFRLRVRTWRGVAAELGWPASVAARVADSEDDVLLPRLAAEFGVDERDLIALYEGQRSVAHADLIAERGDPRPVPWA